jgi:hypothetical protein
VANDVDINVRTDQRDVNFDAAKKGSAGLRNQVVADAAAMQTATDRLASAQRNEADQVGKVRVAQARLNELQESGKAKASQLVAANERLAAAQRKATAAQEAAAEAGKRLNAVHEEAAAATKDTETTAKVNIDVSKGIQGMKAGMVGELKSAGVIGGAAMAGGIAAGLSSVGAAGMFIGIAAAAQSQNPKVAESFGQLWNQVKAGARDASGELSDEFIGSAEKLGATFNRLQPQMEQAFAASGPVVDDLADGVSRMATQAMPGLVTAAGAAAQASGGMADAMESAGRGVANFFTESSHGAAAGGEAFRSFGQIVERLGTFVGKILADLANSSTSVMPDMVQAVDATADAVENLAHAALPSLASGATLALNGLTLLMQLANLLISVLGPLAPQVLNVMTAMKALDMITFGGVSKSFDTFKTSIGSAEGFFGKAKAGAAGLVTTLGPMALATAGVTIALDLYGAAQQRAAQNTANNKRNAESLSDILKESNGVLDASAKAFMLKAAADRQVEGSGKSVLKIMQDQGISIDTLTAAMSGNKGAQDELTGAMDRFRNAGHISAATGEDLELALSDLNGIYPEAKRQNDALADSQLGAADAAKKHDDALKNLRERLSGAVDADLAYRDAVDGLQEAQNTAAEALKSHGKKSEEYTDASRGVEHAMIDQANAARDLAIANSTATTETGKATDGAAAYAREVLNMAVAAGSNAPPALLEMVSGLDATALAAIGAERTVTGAGQSVIKLPNGKTITIDAKDDATAKAAAASAYIQSLPPMKLITIEERHLITQSLGNVPSGWQSAGRKAAGGPVAGVTAAAGGARTGAITVNEMGLETATLPNRDVVTLPTGSQVNPHAGNRALQGDGGGAAPVFMLDPSGLEGPLSRAIFEWLRGAVRKRGGGNVQKALGD